MDQLSSTNQYFVSGNLLSKSGIIDSILPTNRSHQILNGDVGFSINKIATLPFDKTRNAYFMIREGFNPQSFEQNPVSNDGVLFYCSGDVTYIRVFTNNGGAITHGTHNC